LFHFTLLHSCAHCQEIDFYSFYRSNSSLHYRTIFISSHKARGRESSLDASLRQIISRWNAMTFPIRNSPHDGINFAWYHGNEFVFHKEFYYIEEKDSVSTWYRFEVLLREISDLDFRSKINLDKTLIKSIVRYE